MRYTWSMIFSLTWEMVSQLRTLTGMASAPSSWTITLTVCQRTQGEEPVWGPSLSLPAKVGAASGPSWPHPQVEERGWL